MQGPLFVAPHAVHSPSASSSRSFDCTPSSRATTRPRSKTLEISTKLFFCCNICLDDLCPSLQLVGKFAEQRSQGSARPAVIGVEVHHDRDIGFKYLGVEGGVCDLIHDLGRTVLLIES